MAGIHESVAIQKNAPLWNQRLADSPGVLLRESHISGAIAKRQSADSPMGGNDAQRRKPGKNQAKGTSFLRVSVITA
jgi:hypothetical protein